MIGEIRDLETAQIAVQASLTGHLVLATLHTNDAASAVTRLADMGVEPYPAGVEPARRARAAPRAHAVPRVPQGAPRPATPRDARSCRPTCGDRLAATRPRGCEACNETGYRGRTGIYELIVDRKCAELVRSGSSEQVLRDYNARHGFVGLRADGVRWIAAGETTLDEVLRVTRASVETET